MATTTELRKKFGALQAESVGWFESAKAAGGDWMKVDGLQGDEAARFDQVEQRGRELDELREQIIEIEKRELETEKRESELEDLERRAAIVLPDPPRARSPIPATPDLSRSSIQEPIEQRGLFAREMLKNTQFLNGRTWHKPLELRAIFGTGRVTGAPVGYPPQSTRTGEVFAMPLGPQDPFDIIPQFPTNQENIVYMEETLQTRAATRVLEAGNYPEAAFAYTQRTVPVSKVGAFLPVTEESMDQPEFSADQIEMQLANAVRRNATALITTGTSVANHWTGLAGYVRGADRAEPATGRIGLVNKGSDSYTDALMVAFMRIITYGAATPDGLLVHPLDWEQIRLERGPDGQYINGGPGSFAGVNPWGLRIMYSTDLPRGTAYLGAWSIYARIHDRQSLEIKMTDSHASDFIRGVITLRGDVRFAFYLARPATFFAVDWLN